MMIPNPKLLVKRKSLVPKLRWVASVRKRRREAKPMMKEKLREITTPNKSKVSQLSKHQTQVVDSTTKTLSS